MIAVVLVSLALAADAAPALPLPEPVPIPEVRRVSLSDALKQALARNPTAAAAAQELARAQALMAQARALALPTLGVSGTYTRLDDDRRLGDQIILGKDQLSASATLTVPLIAPQRWANWRRGALSVDAADAGAHEVRRSVAIATVRAYFTIITQRRVIEANERALHNSQYHRSFASQRFDKGLGSKLDLLRAERELGQTTSQLQSSIAGLFRAREALGVLVGEDAPVDAFDIDLSQGGGDPLLQPPSSEADAAEQALAQRADVVAARARFTAADKSLHASWTDYMPSVIGTFAPFFQNPPSLTQPLLGWQLFITAQWTIYDGGLRYGQADERRAQFEQARLQLEAAERQAHADIRASFAAYDRAKQAAESAKRAAAAATEAYGLADTAYRAGAITGLDLIDAQRADRDAATFAASVDDQLRQAVLDLLAATGADPF